MVLDRQKVRTDGQTDGRNGRRQNYIPPTNVSYLLQLCLHAKFQQKILIIALDIAKFKYLTFDPLGGVKGGGVKL